MKNFIVVSLFAVLLVVPIAPAQAATYYNTSSTADLVAQLEQLIAMLRAQQQSQYQYQYYYYTPKPTTTYWPYSYTHGSANIIGNPRPHGSSGSSNNDDDEPDVTTDEAEDIEDTSAQLQGEVDMNDFNNGKVFFVYGEDEDLVEDIENEYDQYSDIDEEGDDLQVVLVDSDLDDDASYYFDIYGLDDDTDHYFQICVEYENEDDDDTISCGGVESFTTDD